MGPRILKSVQAIALAAAFATTSLPSPAQTPVFNCVPPPALVPGLEGGPVWFPSVAATGLVVRPELDDPRWSGGALVPFEGAGGIGAPSYRVVRDGEYLSVSVHAPLGYSHSDTVYFGFTQGNVATSKAYVLPITPSSAAAAVDPIPTPVSHYFEWCGTGPCAPIPPATTLDCPQYTWCHRGTPPPAWLQDVATYRSSVAGSLDFAVSFKIRYFSPTGAPVVAIPLTSQFRMFLGLGLSASTGTIEYSVPLIPAGTTQWVDDATHVPASYTAWARFNGLGPVCNRGVTLDPLDINTAPVDADTNSFSVTARNVVGKKTPSAQTIIASIRTAEWGAVSCDPNAAWDPLPSPATWNWQWLGSSTGPIHPNMDSAMMSFTCDTASTTDPNCPTLPATGGAVGPIRTLLGIIGPNGVPGQYLNFAAPSAYRNLLFASLSEFEQSATISIKGLEKLTGKKVAKRDVYLQIKRRNMRPHGRGLMELPLKEMKRVQAFVQNPPSAPPFGDPPVIEALAQARAGAPPAKAVVPSKPGLPQTKDLPQPQDPGPGKDQPPSSYDHDEIPLEHSAASRIELLTRVWPTYEVHAFYDTGDTILVAGKRQKVLHPLLPFGYLLQHSGPFYGFTDLLTREDGAPLEQVGPDMYRISIPAEGKVRIKSRIRAEEQPPCNDCCQCKPPIVNVNVRGCHCRAVGGNVDDRGLLPLALLPLAVFFARRRRASRSRSRN